MRFEWRVFDTAAGLVDELATAVCREAANAIANRGVFQLALAGGSTPLALYRELAQRHAGDSNWQIWHGDERCLPADHPERNSLMADAAWLSASGIPLANRHPIPAELGAQEAAAVYAKQLKNAGDFDLVLLGMGEDGHTASLFPGHAWGEAADSPDTLAVFDSPKPPPQRVSLSAARLKRSRGVWFVVAGAGKRDALARWKQGEALPVSVIKGREETVVWLDRAAAPDSTALG